MELSVKDRLMLGSLFPQTGSIITQTIIKDVAKKIEFPQDEIKEIGLKDTGKGQLHWDDEKATPKEITFTKTELEFLKQQVERFDKEKKVTQDNLDLCIKIKNTEPEAD